MLWKKTEKNSNVFLPNIKLLAFLLSVKILYCLRTYNYLLYGMPQVYDPPIMAVINSVLKWPYKF